MQFTVTPKEKYSRLNFWMRALFVYYILYIVHFILLMGYSYATYVASWLNMLIGFLTGKRHYELTDFVIKGMKWQYKTGLSIMGILEDVPHIDVYKEANDEFFNIELDVSENVSKFYAILRLNPVFIMIALIPHLLYLFILMIAFSVMYMIGFVAILFTGTWIPGIFNFIIGFERYTARVSLYMYGLTDSYPSFSLGE